MVPSSSRGDGCLVARYTSDLQGEKQNASLENCLDSLALSILLSVTIFDTEVGFIPLLIYRIDAHMLDGKS